MLNKMMPEHFDAAIQFFATLNRDDGVEILSYLFFVAIFACDRSMELLAEYDLKNADKIKKGGAA